MDPLYFLESQDPVETVVMLAIKDRWFHRREELDRQLANLIIDALGKATKS